MFFPDCAPFFAPDENYVVFASIRQENVQSEIELYVSFKKPDGGWTPAKNLGRMVNRGRSWRPYITPDGRFLFYNSDHSGIYEYYWINTDFIKDKKNHLYPEF